MKGWVGVSTLLAVIVILQGPVHPSQFTVTRVIDGNTVRARGHDIEIVIRCDQRLLLSGEREASVEHLQGERRTRMTQHPDIKFPWQDFAVWLREGITAARILNKFMIASWPEEHRRERGVSLAPLPVRQEETELLRVVEAHVAQERAQALKFADKLEEGHAYFAISAAQAQSLWSAFMEYGTDGKRSHAIKEGLKTLIQIHPDNVDASAVAFMDHLWKTLGPATAPDRRAIEKASS